MPKSNGATYSDILSIYREHGISGLAERFPHHTALFVRARDGRNIAFDVVQEDDLAGLEELLRMHCPIDVVDNNGLSLLHFAAMNHGLRVAERLLIAGIECDRVDQFGNTPLARATFDSRGRGDMIHLLLRYGADPDHKNNHGVSPRSLAESIANYNVSQYFPSREPLDP